jgi:hypothetical protein
MLEATVRPYTDAQTLPTTRLHYTGIRKSVSVAHADDPRMRTDEDG